MRFLLNMVFFSIVMLDFRGVHLHLGAPIFQVSAMLVYQS